MWISGVLKNQNIVMYKIIKPKTNFGYKYTQDFIRFIEKPLYRKVNKSYNGLVSITGVILIYTMLIQCNTIGEYNVSIIR